MFDLVGREGSNCVGQAGGICGLCIISWTNEMDACLRTFPPHVSFLSNVRIKQVVAISLSGESGNVPFSKPICQRVLRLKKEQKVEK